MGNTQVIDGISFFTFLNEASVSSAFFSRSFCGSKCIPSRPPFRSCRHLTWFRRAKSGRSPVRTPSLSRDGGGCVTLRCQVQRELAERGIRQTAIHVKYCKFVVPIDGELLKNINSQRPSLILSALHCQIPYCTNHRGLSLPPTKKREEGK